jgi:protein SCO1
MRTRFRLVLCLLLAAGGLSCRAQMFPPQFRDIGIEQRLGAQIPLSAVFRDQSGAVVHLGDYFHNKPVLLMPVYYTCTTLCGEALRGLVEGIGTLRMVPGRDFEIVAFSINPAENPADALNKLNECTMNYNGKQGGPGWHFLTGSVASINAVTEAIGFRYRYNAQQQMYVHASGMMVATPGGRVSHYLLGVAYQPRDLKQAISDATRNEIGASTPLLRLLCYPFAASNGRYNAITLLALHWMAGATIMGLFVGLLALWRFDRARQRAAVDSGAAS